jgi:CRP/FNR family transcriptional regulator, cyclic AMP receptor protein
MKTLDELVAESPIFSGLDQSDLELIAGCGQNTVFEAGKYLFREGDAADTFYMVRHGRVQVQTFVPGRGAVTLDTVDEGEIVGWSWLFPPYQWRFDARALDLVRAVSFDGACLRGKCAEDSHLGYELMLRFSQVMVDRLEATRLQLLEIHGSAA